MLDIANIQRTLDTRRVGRRIEHLESTTSTNDAAWAQIDLGGADGLVVFAEHQSAGRGRFGRKWESPKGASLLCSVAIVDTSDEISGGELSLLSAVAVRDAIARCSEVVPTIKWPNDLLVLRRKLGGILVESRANGGGGRVYVVGIGINCLQQRGHISPDLIDRATSLELESKQKIDRNELAAAVLAELDGWLADPGGWTYEKLHRDWLLRAEPLGWRVRLQHAGKIHSGSVVDIDPNAALVVQLDEGGIRAFNVADTTVVPDDPSATE
ncbi:MAG: biotin--[acetyl-CoA-carboxylase] ligase [Phycisphaerales bacterium]|nr:MAG: biotin--[acetyl-CoA-carboxylase] ligase [Phycisphaerales bacterium]